MSAKDTKSGQINAGRYTCNETPHFDKCFDRETARCVECDTVWGVRHEYAQHCFTRGTTSSSLIRDTCNLWDPDHGWNCDWITARRDLDPCAADAAWMLATGAFVLAWLVMVCCHSRPAPKTSVGTEVASPANKAHTEKQKPGPRAV